MKRLFWLGVGVATGVTLSRKAKETARQATPAGIAGNLGAAISELAGAIGSFGADVRAGMAEREEELSDVVERRSGVTPGPRHALGAWEESRDAARPDRAAGRRALPDARARRAGG
ncbi:hypothetical protein [Actinophytocola xanthii]|uniref:Secreted protein n=1 Tax=Actinophytocola xanthii TaxID=1912961 RepID=A0A1Q8CYW9_9PSEU|nr:hypothetical protein [Actinophytocola xanthii]OLF19561.1 hypothetical protein BU204_01165 [Actinophytocola xanthii]